jgi:hypothetical protein
MGRARLFVPGSSLYPIERLLKELEIAGVADFGLCRVIR